MSWRALVDRLSFEHRQHAYTRVAAQALEEYELGLNEALTLPSRIAAAHQFIRRQNMAKANEVVKRAAKMMGTRHAELNVITGDEQITIASVDTGTNTVHCSDGWCQHVVGLGRELAIDDATQHALVRGTDVAHSGSIMSYMGTPIVFNGHVVAVLCVYGNEKRAWAEADAERLRDLTEGLRS